MMPIAMLRVINLPVRLTSAQLLFWSSLFIALVCNYPFIHAVFLATSPNSLSEWLFFLSVPALLLNITILLLSMAGAFLSPRFTAAITIVISVLLLYATVSYGVVFDRSMFQNIAETHPAEAASYLNLSLFTFIIFVGFLPAVMLFRSSRREKAKIRAKKLLRLNLFAVISIALIAGFLFKDYAAVGRNHKELTRYLVPYAFYNAAYKYVRDSYLRPPMSFRILDKSPGIAANKKGQPKTVVVVVGETARADKFGINGYYKNTTPHLSSIGAISFDKVTSCGTATAVSVPCMFSRLSRENYDSRLADSQDNVLDIIRRAGATVSWIDNNSSCKGVCKRIDTIAYDPSRDSSLCDGDYCYDEVLLPLLEKKLAEQTGSQRVIVLHMIGSHGPTYYRRYPQTFRKFLPDCPRSDIQNCTEEQLQNTYDNTIAYTDHVLSRIIQSLQNVPNASMLYISDHGESLGEAGMYLHGFPYAFAPEAQTHVPMIYWDSNLSDPNFQNCVSAQSRQPLSQDNLYDTLLGLTHVRSSTYQPEMDVLKSCRT